MNRQRITVTLICFDPAYEDPPFAQEWVHEDGYSSDEQGCRLSWEDGGGDETYIPWTSVLRVDWSRCDCMECKERAT